MVDRPATAPGAPAAPGRPVWATLRTERTVLLVAHNTTTLNRLLDVADLVARDPRVQCLVTSELEDPFADRLPTEVEALGFPAIPWDQAARGEFDLIISASHHGRLEDLHGPLVLLSHGVGFSKYSPGTPPGPGAQRVFGLGPEWLLRHGRPLAAALGFPHPGQLAHLADQVPAAATSAVVVGDRTFDRMLASLERRGRYRTALAVPDDGRLVVISSTWGAFGTLGAWPELVGRLVDEADVTRVALVAHPNIWAWHGGYQLRAWLADAVDRGLIIVPPLEGWQATLVAADAVVGDHGSVTVYGAALGRPTVLAAFPGDEVVPGTAAAALGEAARRLDRDAPLGPQLQACVDDWAPERSRDVAQLVTSAPGEASARLAGLFSGLLRLDVPLTSVPAAPYGVPFPAAATSDDVSRTPVP